MPEGFNMEMYYTCTPYDWQDYGRTEVVRGPKYSTSKKAVFIQFDGDITIPTFADGIVVEVKVFEMGSSNSRSPLSRKGGGRSGGIRHGGSNSKGDGKGGGSTLVYDFAVALSDLLQSPNATVYPKDIPIGLKVKMPLGEVGVNVDTGASAVFDLSDDLRQLKVYEHYTTPPTSPLNVPSQLLHMYSNRIRELLNIYADDAGQYALLQQRELLNNYMAFKTQLIPSMGNKSILIGIVY